MSLRWNTCKLLSPEGQRGIPVEFHFLSGRELFDSTILSADRHHSSAGEWVVYGDHRWLHGGRGDATRLRVTTRALFIIRMLHTTRD
jgi:hypothetical protein